MTYQIEVIATQEIIVTSADPTWSDGIWDCGNVRFTDINKDLYSNVSTPPVSDFSAQNKAQAMSLLSATDWTTIPDVSNPAASNPYLTNVSEFAAYRSTVRNIAVSPPTDSVVFPVAPNEVWSN